MSRMAELIALVKKDLNQYNQRDINNNQIIFGLNKAQEQIIFREEILEYTIPITIISGTNIYSTIYSYPSLNPTNTVIPKRVKSWRFPSTWYCDTKFKTPQEFDAIKSYFPTLSYPEYAIIRNNSNLEFYATPGDTYNGLIIYLQCILKKQSRDASSSIDFEVDSIYNDALRWFTNYHLLPIDHPSRGQCFIEFENELTKYRNQLVNRESYNQVVDCTE